MEQIRLPGSCECRRSCREGGEHPKGTGLPDFRARFGMNWRLSEWESRLLVEEGSFL